MREHISFRSRRRLEAFLIERSAAHLSMARAYAAHKPRPRRVITMIRNRAESINIGEYSSKGAASRPIDLTQSHVCERLKRGVISSYMPIDDIVRYSVRASGSNRREERADYIVKLSLHSLTRESSDPRRSWGATRHLSCGWMYTESYSWLAPGCTHSRANMYENARSCYRAPSLLFHVTSLVSLTSGRN